MGQGQSSTGESHGDKVATSRTKEQERFYAQGVEDSTKQMNMILSQVADQVYSNVTNQLSDIQDKQLERTEKLTASLKIKMDPLVDRIPRQKACLEETNLLLQCMQQKAVKEGPTACTKLVDSLSACAKNSLK